jgi:hypothetical protein
MPSNEGLGLAYGLKPFKVLVVGGSYAGLSATLNLLDLCEGKQPRFTRTGTETTRAGKLPVEITVVDERDGYCR